MLLYSRSRFLLFILVDLSIRSTKTDAANDVPINRLEVFQLHEKSKFENILLSIEELSKTLVEKEKEDNINLSQTTSDLQVITQRLQTIESQINQMEQTEIFNKQRFELFQDSYIKEGIQFDDIKRRAEKYQLHMTNLIGEVDASVEKVHTEQDILLREVRRMSIIQAQLLNTVNQLSENIKTDWNKFNTSLRASQQNFTEELKDVFKNFTIFMTAAIDIITHKPVSSTYETSTQTHPRARNDEGIIPSWLGQIFNMKNKFETTQEEMKSVRSLMDKCIDIGERMHEDFVTQKMDFINLVSDIQRFIVDELRKKENDDIDRLSMSFQTSIVPLQQEQEKFKNGCYLIQANGERLEERALYVLENLFNFINNHTEGIRSDLNQLQQYGTKQSTEQTKEIQKIIELLDNQKNCAAKEKEVTKKPSTTRPADIQSKRLKPNTVQPTPQTKNVHDRVMFDQPYHYEDDLELNDDDDDDS